MEVQTTGVSARKDSPGTILMEYVDRKRIFVTGLNPRKYFDEDGLRELADSIREHGILEPLMVRYVPAGGYELIAGERRLRAAEMVGLDVIPVTIRDYIDDKTAVTLALIENLCRRDINPIEEAEGYQFLVDEGYKQSEIAEKVNRSPEAISNAIRLLRLPDEVKTQIAFGRLTTSHGKALLAYIDQPVLLKSQIHRALNSNVTSKELEKVTWQQGAELVREGVAEIVPHDKVDISKCRGCSDSFMAEGVRFCLKLECLRLATQGEPDEPQIDDESETIVDEAPQPNAELDAWSDQREAERNDTRRQADARRLNAALARITQDGVMSDLAAMAVYSTLVEINPKYVTEAEEHLGTGFDCRFLEEPAYEEDDFMARLCDHLATLPSASIILLSAEAVLRQEANCSIGSDVLNWFLRDAETSKKQPESAAQVIEFARFIDENGAIYYTGQGLGSGDNSQWFTLKKKSETAGSHRVKSPALMTRGTREQAQADLDRYAEKHGLKKEIATCSCPAERECPGDCATCPNEFDCAKSKIKSDPDNGFRVRAEISAND